MVRQLTKEVKSQILDEPELYAKVCRIVGVRVLSLSQLMYRNSPLLVSHYAVTKISEAMNKKPDEILEKAEEAVAAGA